VYLLVGGVKRWILSPDVFAANGWRFEPTIRAVAVKLEAALRRAARR